MPQLITLLTDFGQSDSYVAEVKGVLLSAAPGATLIDISHEVPLGMVVAGQYLLSRAWHRYPTGTVHLVVVDPGVGTPRRALAASAGGHYFVAPDNGLLTPVLDAATVVQLAIPDGASATFHGRDVFAPAAARLALGEALEGLGPAVADPVRSPLPAPREERGCVVGEVIYIDRFGTLITNVPAAAIEGAGQVTIGGEFSAGVGRTFRDVELGSLVAFGGSGGTVEIAARERSAAQALGVGVGAEVRVGATDTRGEVGG
ncbi:MAG: SAM-dependent chlorinase/fluorinase [Gemmatimonadota bacterium]|nr:MAG: SAM-dependent chlorinase/fluorinase [Gemmatimonadota bacterium]